MAVIRQEKVIEILTSDNTSAREALAGDINSAIGYYHHSVSSRYDRDSAIALYDQLRRYVTDRGFFYTKTLRPWHHDEDVLGKLDRSQPWWGWEFEMGFASQGEREEVINHTWDTWDGVTYDAEGEGGYQSEITFAPSERSTYYDGTAPALQFLQYISENRIGVNGGEAMVGTHLNLSLPGFDDHVTVDHVAVGLLASVAFLPMTDEDGNNIRQQMFGRSRLYGGFYGHGSYIEAKLFRTTYNADRFAEYIRAAEVITQAAQAILAKVEEYPDTRTHELIAGSPSARVMVTNLWEMFNGSETEPTIKTVQPVKGLSMDYHQTYGFYFRTIDRTVEHGTPQAHWWTSTNPEATHGQLHGSEAMAYLEEVHPQPLQQAA